MNLKIDTVFNSIAPSMQTTLIFSILAASHIWGNIVPTAVAQNIQTASPTPAPTTANIDLSSSGAEPRRELKFRPAVNSKQSVVLTMDMSMKSTIGETPLPTKPIPKMVLKIDAIVRQVDANGDIHCSFGYADVRAIADKSTPPEVIAAAQKSLKSMVGLKIDLVVASNGQLKTKNLILPRNITPAIEQTLRQFDRSIEQLMIPLPTDKIGLGAKWRTTNALAISGIKFDAAATAEIVELSATGMTIKTTISQSAPPQEFAVPGTGKAVKSQINSLVSTSEGRYTIRFDSLLPIAGQSLTNTDSQTSVQTGANEPPTNVSSQVSIDLNISSK